MPVGYLRLSGHLRQLHEFADELPSPRRRAIRSIAFNLCDSASLCSLELPQRHARIPVGGRPPCRVVVSRV